MTIFCDTNIVMKYLQQRQFASQVEQVLNYSVQNGHDIFISIGSFYTITYLTERYLKADQMLSKGDRISQLRYILNGVLGIFKLAGHYSQTISDGVNDPIFDDLEDSYQAHVAKDFGCDVLLTINEKHFSRFNGISSLKVLTPSSFIETYIP